MQTLVIQSRLPASASTAFAWHERPFALERLTPPWMPVTVMERTGGIRDGGRVKLSTSFGPFDLPWELVHEGYVEGERFQDRQVRGPFAAWAHVHRVSPDGPSACVWTDELRYQLPAGGLGAAVAGGSVERRLASVFAHRHRQLAADLERHHRASHRGPMKVVISGASGLMGSTLRAFLATGGHQVFRLVRRPPEREDEIRWDPAQGTVDEARLEGMDAVVHLAGEGIAEGRWTDERKRRIRDSRIQGTKTIAQALARLRTPPGVLISASAAGYYGAHPESEVDEGASAGTDFLAGICREWEAAAAPAADKGIRLVTPRFGVILSPAGGMLKRLLPVFTAGIGGRVGDGAQGLSWMALDDAVGVLHRALYDETMTGPYNLVSPTPSTNAELTSTLADVLSRPAVMTVPAAAIKLMFGEMGETLLLRGPKLLPRRLTEAGFAPRFPELRTALATMLGKAAVPEAVRDGSVATISL